MQNELRAILLLSSIPPRPTPATRVSVLDLATIAFEALIDSTQRVTRHCIVLQYLARLDIAVER